MDFLKPRLTPMNRRRRIYEGKAKVLYEGPEPGTLIQHFKDDATAFNAKKHEVIDGKGVLNNRISEYVFQNLNSIGVPTHFIRRLNMREQLIREVEIVPLEVVVRSLQLDFGAARHLRLHGAILENRLDHQAHLAQGRVIRARMDAGQQGLERLRHKTQKPDMTRNATLLCQALKAGPIRTRSTDDVNQIGIVLNEGRQRPDHLIDAFARLKP